MERHQLEDRIRASLHARAEDVVPTPELWERVSTRTARAVRWRVGLLALSGVAAVALAVVGGIVLLGSPRGVGIDQEPDFVDTPSTTPTPTEQPTGGVVVGSAPAVVTTDGATLYEVDPATGEVRRELFPFEGFAEGAAIREVALRPVSDEGVATIASVIEIEGSYDLEVSVFDAEGTRVRRVRVAMGTPATDVPPDVVWSQDGRYLLWAGTSGGAGPALWAVDWVGLPGDADVLPVEPFSATPPGGAGELFARGDVVDLRQWTGPAHGDSVLRATTSSGGVYRVDLSADASDCAGLEPCQPTWTATVTETPFEGGAVIDTGTLASGVDVTLVAGCPAGAQDAECATLRLVAGPMDDMGHDLAIPDLAPNGTAAPGDAWMSVAGNTVAVGFPGLSAHLVTLTGDTIEDTAVAGSVPLPEGTTMAGLALSTLAPPSGAPSEQPDTAAVLDDGLSRYVVGAYPSAQELLLLDRTAPDTPVTTWGRPDGLVAEDTLAGVTVWPGSTPDHVELVAAWYGAGESGPMLSRTVVDGGEVVANALFPADLQPAGPGFDAGPDPQPVFDPTGRWLAWVEPGQATPSALHVVGWADGAPTSDALVADLDELPALGSLDDWAAVPDEEPATVLTARVADPEATQLVELRVQATDTTVDFAGDPSQVALPGVPLAVGSFLFEDGSTRYVAWDEDVVRYAQLASGVSVPTVLDGPEAGEVVAFGPDRAVVRLADGRWQVVQVDDGASSAVDVPGATIAFLPLPDPRG